MRSVAWYLSTTPGLAAGEYTWLSDTFGLPVGAPNEPAAIAWLRLLGSLEGQNAFNPLKGSILARTDAFDLAVGST